MNFKLISFLLLNFHFLFLHAGSGSISLADTSKFFYVSNNEIYSNDKRELLYFQKGNIFFSGSTDERQNIFLMTTSVNPSSDKLELIYEKDNRVEAFSFKKNRFYIGKPETDELREVSELSHI